MEKGCSIILVFFLLFFNSQGVFAGNGYPLTPEHICDIREKLMEWAKSKQTSTIEFKWEKKPDYYLLSDEYRTIKVYNIPHLFYYDGQKKSDDKGFFETYLRALLSAYKAQESFKSYENEAKEAVADYLINKLDEEFKKYNCYDAIRKFIGNDKIEDEVVLQSFITSIILSSNSKILGSIVAASCVAINFINYFQCLLPASFAINPALGITITVVHNLLNITRMFTTKSAFNEERISNYALLVASVNQLLLNANPDDPDDDVYNSNILVTAVDERDFYCFWIWNSVPGRRNDGAWAKFEKIGNLPCSPSMKEYKDGRTVSKYIEIFKELMTNKNLDLKKIENWLNDATDTGINTPSADNSWCNIV